MSGQGEYPARRWPGLRLGFKLGLPFLLITIVMMLVVGYMVWSSYQTQIRYAQERQRQASVQASFQVASYVSLFRDQLDDAARGLVYAGDDRSRQRDWLERVQLTRRHFYDLAVTDLTGQETARVIWLVPEYRVLLQTRTDTPAVNAALGGRFYLGRVYLSQLHQAPFVQMATPRYDASGNLTGTLVAEVDLSHLWWLVTDIEAGRGGYAYVVDEAGRLIAYRESEMVQGPVKQVPEVENVPAVQSYLTQRTESASVVEYPWGLQCILHQQCEPVLAYHRPIETTGWGVIVEQPAGEAYAEANKLLALAIGLAVVALVILMALGVYIRRGVLRPISLLGEGAAALAGGHLTQRIAIHTGDEIETLAHKFNAMAESLYQSQTQLEEYARTLEQRVAERTTQLQQANLALSRRAVQLDTSSLVARQVTSILDLDELLPMVVNLIQEGFGYYFVGIWLLTGAQDAVTLRAGTGRAGEELPEQGFSIPMEATSIIVDVCKTGRCRCVDDVRQASDYLAVEALPDVRSELALPLKMGEVVIGVLDIESDQLAAFTPDDQLVLQTLADQITIAIRNAQFYKTEQMRRWFAESLERAGRELSSSLDLRQVPGQILEQLAGVVPYERGAVMLQEDRELRIIAQRGFPDEQRALESVIPIREGDVFHRVAIAGRPVLIDDVTAVSGWQQMEWLPVHRSWMGVPLMVRDKVIGMISLTRREAAAFSPDDATLVSAFAGQAAIALENASLYDEITRFNEQLEQMVLQRTQELNRAYQTLERLDKTKSDFIAVAAHELRTPLTVMQGYAAMVRADATVQKNPYLMEAMAGLLGGIERLSEIINSMLDIARIDSQVLELRPEPTWIAPLIRQAQHEFKTALQERHLRFDIEPGLDSLPHIQADPKLLYKVFLNVISNAIKFTPDGGTITVSGVHIHAEQLGEYVEVLVRDTGIGIAPEYHELIFEKFYQTGRVALHSSGKTKFKGGGPGLGLSIARGIVQAHNGRIWVESEGCDEERCPGSCFHILLPVAGVQAGPARLDQVS